MTNKYVQDIKKIVGIDVNQSSLGVAAQKASIDGRKGVAYFNQDSQTISSNKGTSGQTGGNPAPAAGEFAGPALPAGIEIVTTPSGLQYADTQVGTGATAEAGQMISMYYTGYLMDASVFDSNTSGEGFSFPLGGRQVIAGWDEGIVGMKEGGKRRLIIPAELAYGAGGRGQIPPNATLVFDVELVKIGP